MRFLLLALAFLMPLPVLSASTITCTVQNEAPMPLTMASGWGATTFAGSDGKFYKDVNGVVRLEGMMYKFTGPAVGEIAFVLPVGYRPAAPQWFIADSQYGKASLIVHPSGEVQIVVDYGYFTWVSLASISFRAA